MGMYKMVAPKTLDAMAKRIVEHFSPTRVILFGSYASGNQTTDSDVDFLIVMPFSRRRLDIALEIRKSLRGFGVAKDVVVLKPQEFEAQKNIPGTVAYPANHEGKVLYAT